MVSLIETDPVTGAATGRVLWMGPSGLLELAQGPVSGSGDFAIAADGGSLLVITQGALSRLTLSAPLPVPPGQLQAPTNPVVGVPFGVLLTGRPFALSPFILAADLPLSPPAFPGGVLPIPPFGVVHTSLGLQPTFVALRDGVGLFGLPDPTATLGPAGTWSETYTLPAGLFGITLVLQGYIVDLQAPNGLFWITNPVFLTGS